MVSRIRDSAASICEIADLFPTYPRLGSGNTFVVRVFMPLIPGETRFWIPSCIEARSFVASREKRQHFSWRDVRNHGRVLNKYVIIYWNYIRSFINNCTVLKQCFIGSIITVMIEFIDMPDFRLSERHL